MGDSTSMTIGAERHMYPFIMADHACWPPSTEIINCSLPGFTSADACAFFFRHQKEFPDLKTVVLNIGTCDAASWEIRKGRYTLLRQTVDRLKESLGLRKERTRLKNRLLHFEWNTTFDPNIEFSESPEDYEYNLSRIVDACIKSSIAVILIRPKSNLRLPPGLGKGNFVFYRYLGLNDRLSQRLSIPDGRFKEALALQETGDLAGAADKYREIFLNLTQLSFHYEYPLIVVNNYAVCAAEKGDLDEAEALLLLLLKERNARREITLYNLAEIYRMRGNEGKYWQYLSESYEMDNSMYRIRFPYLAAIDRISSRFGNGVAIIDQQEIIEDELYVDHTHSLKEGQVQVASRIIDLLNDRQRTGTNKAQVRNILYNPELALGNTTEFYTYFRTYEPFGEEEITWHVNRIRNALGREDSPVRDSAILQGLPKELRTAVGYHLTHPCFPSLYFLLRFGPRYPSDVGRFPEYFLVRHLVPYLRFFEKEPAFADSFSDDANILRKSDDLLAMLPEDVRRLVSMKDPAFDQSIETLRLPAILSMCKQSLLAHLLQGNQVHNRMKTTIFWYFRETLRYGSHSRISMRYERTRLEYIAEALSVASILNLKLTANREGEIRTLIQHLEETVRIHEYFCSEFGTNNKDQNLLIEYDRRLSDVARELDSN